MHHGSELNEKMRRLAQDEELGATSQFPEGKLTPEDEGEIKIAIGSQDGKVVINFGKPVAWIGMDPKQARQFADMIRKQSYRAEGK